ncbi:MAG: hypothetical protein C5B55_11315 [Blastocatellia bacterium]|nr:MAG: hypothetical protein C5B55_11315 [Blastocatellia bacterium]
MWKIARAGKGQTVNNKRLLRWVVIIVLILLLIPVITMLGAMMMGATIGGGMMRSMGGMMSTRATGLGLAWLILVAAALVFLLITVARGRTRL